MKKNNHRQLLPYCKITDKRTVRQISLSSLISELPKAVGVRPTVDLLIDWLKSAVSRSISGRNWSQEMHWHSDRFDVETGTVRCI